jgi:hypothetical protein
VATVWRLNSFVGIFGFRVIVHALRVLFFAWFFDNHELGLLIFDGLVVDYERLSSLSPRDCGRIFSGLE